jgi:DNA gyrase subunit A
MNLVTDITGENLEDIFEGYIKDDYKKKDIASVNTIATKSFIDYAASVILGRAIPDLRDGLKFAQRRALFAMKELGITHTGATKKSARITGECLIKDTLISTSNGLIPIQNIKVGDQVYTQFGLKNVSQLFYQEKQPLLKIYLNDIYSNVSTLGHKYKIFNENCEFEFKEASQLNIGDYIVMQPSFYDTIDNFNNEECYVLGQLLSDGNIDRNKYKESMFLNFNSSSIDILNRINCFFGNKSNIVSSRYVKKITIYDKKQSIDFINKFNLINKYAYNIHSINNVLNKFSNKNILFFLSGFIDGDGFIRKNGKEIIITSIDDVFLRFLSLLLFDRFGISSDLTRTIEKGEINHYNEKEIKANYDCYNLSFTGDSVKFLSQNLDLSHIKKRNRLQTSVEKLYPSKNNEIPYLGKIIFSLFKEKHLGGGWFKDKNGKKFRLATKYFNGSKIRKPKKFIDNVKIYSDTAESFGFLEKLFLIEEKEIGYKLQEILDKKMKFFKIKSINEEPADITYDFTVEDVHEFIANGFVSSNCIGKFHPHGDASAYETIVNMAQPWKNNLPLVDGQGNWGSIDGDGAASPRYTEARFTKAGSLFFRDIDNDIVDFMPNYDGTEKEPTVLPVPYPAILINGVLAGSIAVGMATSLLPHNPTEVMNALRFMLKNKISNKITTPEEILSIIPSPDFPTGGIVYNTQSMIDIIKTGKGSIRIRAKHNIETINKKSSIIITEIPFAKKKSVLIDEIVAIRKNNKDNPIVSGISNIKDESTKDIRIVIEIKNGWDPEIVWNYLLKHSAFDTSISYFSIVIDTVDKNGEIGFAPKEYGIIQILERYIDFRMELLIRKWEFIKRSSEARLHILEGMIKALDIINEIIECIKRSKKFDVASENLVSEFGFSKLQANAILNMRLSKVTSLEKNELISEKKDVEKIIKESLKILKNLSYRYELLDIDFENIEKEIGCERKTTIVDTFKTISTESIIPEEDCLIYVTEKGYIKRVNAKQIKTSKLEMELTEGDSILNTYETNTHKSLLIVAKNGQVFSTKAFNITDSQSGIFIKNLFEIEGEFHSFMSDMSENIVMLTSNGLIKQSSLSDFSGSSRKSGIAGITLKDNFIMNVFLAKGTENIIIVTKNAKSIKFSLTEVSVTGRSSQGVNSIKLKSDDYIIGAIISKEKSLIELKTENDIIKNVKESDFNLQSRAGVGVFIMSLTKKSGSLSSIKSLI